MTNAFLTVLLTETLLNVDTEVVIICFAVGISFKLSFGFSNGEFVFGFCWLIYSGFGMIVDLLVLTLGYTLCEFDFRLSNLGRSIFWLKSVNASNVSGFPECFCTLWIRSPSGPSFSTNGECLLIVVFD